MASHTAYEIAADESDEDETLISTSASSLLPPASSAPGMAGAKGKGRATPVEGKIGSNGSGNAGFGERSSRQTVGGIQTETRSASSYARVRADD